MPAMIKYTWSYMFLSNTLALCTHMWTLTQLPTKGLTNVIHTKDPHYTNSTPYKTYYSVYNIIVHFQLYVLECTRCYSIRYHDDPQESIGYSVLLQLSSHYLSPVPCYWNCRCNTSFLSCLLMATCLELCPPLQLQQFALGSHFSDLMHNIMYLSFSGRWLLLKATKEPVFPDNIKGD